MTHISSRALREGEFEKLYAQFHAVIGKLTEQKSVLFFDELLTEAEKIMLTKRLSAVLMFKEKQSIYRVAKTLQISPSTAERIRHAYNDGAYTAITNIFDADKKARERFWHTLEVLLRGGMPSMGKDRWQSLKQER